MHAWPARAVQVPTSPPHGTSGPGLRPATTTSVEGGQTESVDDVTDTGPELARPGGAVQLHETHSGIVVLVGEHAYKVKKAVDLGFLDFRTEAARAAACRRELELNRRLAPDVYEDLAVVTGTEGQVLEHVIVMRRMPDGARLSTLVRSGADVDAHLRSLARLMARFHAAADRGPEIDREGTADGLRRRWTNNLDETEQYRGGILDAQVHAQIRTLALRYVEGRATLLTERAGHGLVVDGHGDLIAQDIFCLPDHPRVLDCLEFDDRLRWVDVLDDVCFLAMDLERLGRRDLADRFIDWYAQFSGTPTVPSLADHYIAYRAFVRAKVACIRAAQGEAGCAAEANDLARLSLDHLHTGEVRLVLVGGAPGTGKTTLASVLADRLGWVLLGSDRVRQELRFAADERYTPGGKQATYRELLDRATVLLEHGESVLLDATFADHDSRQRAREVADATSSRLVSLECHAPVALAAARAEQRLAEGGDASEADADVARALAAGREPWPQAVAIDTSRELSGEVSRAERAIAGETP